MSPSFHIFSIFLLLKPDPWLRELQKNTGPQSVLSCPTYIHTVSPAYGSVQEKHILLWRLVSWVCDFAWVAWDLALGRGLMVCGLEIFNSFVFTFVFCMSGIVECVVQGLEPCLWVVRPPCLPGTGP
jgi:hypothetical protein